MADEIPSDPPEAFFVGAVYNLEVTPSPTRTTYFPDTVIVATPPTGAVELILLRTEFVMQTQPGEIVDVQGEQLTVRARAAPLVPQLWDLAHVRVGLDQAIEMSINLLVHVSKHAGADRSALLERLRQELEPPS